MRLLIVSLILLAFIAGCATIMHGSSQSVGISSTPSGANVTIDNGERGKTPIVAKLSRKDHHVVKIELQGYETYEGTLTRQTSGWFGVILFLEAWSVWRLMRFQEAFINLPLIKSQQT